MSETQDLSKSVCVSVEATGTKSHQPHSKNEVLCDTFRFKDSPTEEKCIEEGSVKLEESEEVKEGSNKMTELDKLFSLLGSVSKGGFGLSGLEDKGKSHKNDRPDWKFDSGSDKKSESSCSIDDYEDCYEHNCKNSLMWRSLDKLIDSHLNLTRVFVDIFESEKSDY